MFIHFCVCEGLAENTIDVLYWFGSKFKGKQKYWNKSCKGEVILTQLSVVLLCAILFNLKNIDNQGCTYHAGVKEQIWKKIEKEGKNEQNQEN